MTRKLIQSAALLVAGSLLGAAAMAGEVVAIGNKANTNAVDKAFVARAYSGEARLWADGGAIALIDQGDDNPARADFNQNFLGKSNSNVKAMWGQLIFAGKALPPKVIDGDAEVKKAVAANKNAIGYVRPSSVDDTVKVLAK
jgi:ABC-type phosphate transport system substrate-binding protein